MRGRELGDKRTQLGFFRSSRHCGLGAAGDVDFNLNRTASRGLFLHVHDGSLGLDIEHEVNVPLTTFFPSTDQSFFCQIREVDGVQQNCKVAIVWLNSKPCPRFAILNWCRRFLVSVVKQRTPCPSKTTKPSRSVFSNIPSTVQNPEIVSPPL